MTDATSVAADQLRSKLADPVGRLDYCARKMPYLPNYPQNICVGYGYGRGLGFAAKLLGIPLDAAKSYVCRAKRETAAVALAHYYSRGTATTWPRISALDEALLGYVYFARCVEAPHVIKIGFSRDPAKRLKRVEKIYGTKLDLFGSYSGTELAEELEHKEHWPLRCAHEFYFDSESTNRDTPDFLKPDIIPVRTELGRKRALHDARLMAHVRRTAQ